MQPLRCQPCDPQGYTTPSGQTRKFPAILGEFGSYMNNSQDSCFNDGCIAGEGAVRDVVATGCSYRRSYT